MVKIEAEENNDNNTINEGSNMNKSNNNYTNRTNFDEVANKMEQTLMQTNPVIEDSLGNVGAPLTVSGNPENVRDMLDQSGVVVSEQNCSGDNEIDWAETGKTVLKYTAGAALVVGACYLGYKFFTAGSESSPEGA